MGWKQTIVAAVIVLAAAGPLVVTGNEQPLADAGLDQQVERGATVLVDGTGSRDPDGDLVAYDWRVEAPNGSTFAPECPTCNRTRFRANRTGRYNVTLTVTDDDGATRSDTLYVTVDGASATGPSVELDGEEAPFVGEQATYTARLTVGDAPITSVTWLVDGTAMTERAPSGNVDRWRTSFDSAAPRSVAVRVTDEANRTARATLGVDPQVQQQSPETPPDEADPTISGPRLLTGDPPFSGTYTLQTSAAVTDVDWVTTGDASTSTDSATVDWDPGRQDIYALVTYGSGTVRRATFPSGETEVVVDPRPEVELTGEETGATVTGEAGASDAFGNLERLVLRSNGTVLAQTGSDGRAASESFSASADVLGDTVTAVATDGRGQRAVDTLELTQGRPEVVSAGFVNDPVDSYHPRINQSRYAGEHVVRIDLNGVDPSSVSVDVETNDRNPGLSVQKATTGRAYLEQSDTLVHRSFWASRTTENIEVNTHVSRGTEVIATRAAELQVTSSPPEVRVRVIDDGRNADSGEANYDNRNEWGITVDASNSFDPDGSTLEYIWKPGSSIERGNDGIGHFDSFERGSLEVIDDQDQISVWRYEFHGSYNPGVEQVREISEGPYFPNESVQLRAVSPLFQTTKNSYNVNIHATLDGPGSIESENRVRYRQTTQQYDEDYFGHERYEWTISVPATDLISSESTPSLVTRNPERPEETKRVTSLPTVGVVGLQGAIQNLTVDEMRYLVERQEYDRVAAHSREEAERYKDSGYEVVSSDRTGFVYEVEERVKVSNATYETQERTFDSPRTRRLFLRANPDWRSAGTKRQTVTETVTESEWRDHRGGRGEFTGDTRRVKVDDADYQTEYEYVTTSTTTETVTGERLRCIYGDCWTVEVEETVTRTDRDYYWSSSGGGLAGRPTGDTRRQKVDSADYETQYRYEMSQTQERSVTRYTAERIQLVEPAAYEWQLVEKTSDRSIAKTMVSQSDSYRLGSSRPTREWVLRRPGSSERTWVRSVENRDDVIKTAAVITGERPILTDGDTIGKKRVEHEIVRQGKQTPSRMKNLFRESIEQQIIGMKAEIPR